MTRPRAPLAPAPAPALAPLALALALLAPALLAPGRALACACLPPASIGDATTSLSSMAKNIAAEMENTISQLEAGMSNLATSLADPSNGSLKQMADSISRSMQMQTQSKGLLIDAEMRARTEQALQKEQLQAARDFAPAFGGCKAATAAKGMAAASANTQRQTMIFSKALGDRSGNRPGTPSYQGTSTDMEARVRSWAVNYCNPERFGDMCEQMMGRAGAGLDGQQEGGKRPDADIRVDETLFGQATFIPPRPNTEEAKEPLSGSEAAALELVANLTEPFAPPPVPIALLTSPAGRNALIDRRAADARMDLARSALAQMVALRAPPPEKDEAGEEIVPMGPWARAMLEQVGLPTEAVPDRISQYQLMEILAARRFEGEGWFTELQGAEPVNVDREIAQLSGLLLRLDWEQYRLIERLVSMEATLLAMEVEDQRQPLPFSAVPGSVAPAAAGSTP